jgi:hypothetical protein
MISGYTLYEVQETYISARIETEHGTEWLFFKHVLDLKDGTRVACIPAKAMENTHDIYYRIDDTRATTLEVGTASGQMWDVFAEDTGFRPTNEAKVHHVRKPKSKELLYSYRGYTTGNEKMFNRHKFGVLAGVGMSNPYLKGMDKKGWKYTLGPFYSAGIFARFQVGRDMSVEPQLLFSHISEESEEFEEFDLDSPAGRTYLDVSTLQIPLLFRVHDYSWASDWTLYAELGPALAVNFVTKQESLSDGVSRSDDTTFDIDCLVGAGVEYHFNTRQTLSMGIRYSLRTTGYGTMKTLELVAGLSLFNF